MWRKTHEPPPGPGGFVSPRNRAIVIWDNFPAVRLTGVPHVLRTVPVGSDDRAVHKAVIVLRAFLRAPCCLLTLLTGSDADRTCASSVGTTIPHAKPFLPTTIEIGSPTQEACLVFWDCDLKGPLVSNGRRLDGRKSQRPCDPAQAWFVAHVIEGAVDSDFQDEFVVPIV
jgi:hypothetical protein